MADTLVTLQSAPGEPGLHFINGSLYPSGVTIPVDLAALGLKTVDDTHKPDGGDAKPAPVPLAPNLAKAPKSGGDDLANYEVAAINPTGPNPDKPQAIPAGAVQIGESFVAPAEPEADTAGSAITPETPVDGGTTKKGK